MRVLLPVFDRAGAFLLEAEVVHATDVREEALVHLGVEVGVGVVVDGVVEERRGHHVVARAHVGIELGGVGPVGPAPSSC